MPKKIASNKLTLIVCSSVIALSLIVIGITYDTERSFAYSSEISDLERQIEALQEQDGSISSEQNQLQEEMQRIAEGKKESELAIQKASAELEMTETYLVKKETEIAETEDLAKLSVNELKIAEERITERDGLLQSRLLAMYEAGGNASYLEVLLGSSSFSDFFQRLEFLSYISKHDRDILEEHKHDKALVEQKKAEIEELLSKLDRQMEELHSLQAKYQAQKETQQVQIASFEEQHQEIAEQNEAAEEKLSQVTREMNELMRQKMAVELKKMEEERKQREAEERKQREEEQRKQREEEEQQKLREEEQKQLESEKNNESEQKDNTQEDQNETTEQNQENNSSDNDVSESSSQLGWPVPSSLRITSHFGPRWGRLHGGIDIGAPRGAAIVAAEDGFVSQVVGGCYEGNLTCQGGRGNHVTIVHSGGIDTLYWHIHPGTIIVSPGQRVSKGQQIAQVGNTGHSYGAHLHFEVHANGMRTDPYPYIR